MRGVHITPLVINTLGEATHTHTQHTHTHTHTQTHVHTDTMEKSNFKNQAHARFKNKSILYGWTLWIT